MDIKYEDLISKTLSEVETDAAHEILEHILSTPPLVDSPFETLSAIIKHGFSNVFTFSYVFKSIIIALLITTLLNFFKNFFKNQGIFFGIKYFLTLSVTSAIIFPTYKIIINATAYMRDISTFLGIVFPTLGVLTASGGNVVAAKSQGFFFSLFLSAAQALLNYIVPFVTAFLFGLTVVDAFLGEGKLNNIANFIRKSSFGFFSILISLFYIIISVYGQASKSADAVSARALRLLVSNTIPIVGGTISETLKFVSSGIVNIKNAIGISAVAFIIALFLPIMIFLWGSGIVLNLINCFLDYFNAADLKSTTMNIKYLLDFSLASFSVITVAAIVNINVYLSITPIYLQ